jgi:hypothetical protein
MAKLTVTVTEFRPFPRNTLRGFCTVQVGEMHLIIHDIGVHQHANGARWVALPAKPVVNRDGAAKRTGDDRIEYVRLFSFDSRTVSDAFAAAVIAALLEFDPEAFDESAAFGGGR